MSTTSSLTNRFKPVRAGLLNLFEYGNQVFDFADGHLLLRGHNGAGKSKALELLLPFVLDGDTHPTKLDPFATDSREMKWNLTLGGRYESRWGYAWIEFARHSDGEQPEWVTLAVGIRAHQQTPGSQTWFLVIRNRRIGHDISLINAQTETPVLRRGIQEVLGDAAEVFDEAYAYRERVNELLFAFPSVERYETMLGLQRQLRRPQLSKTLNTEQLSQILTDALPEVDHRRIADIGARLDAIEQLRQDLRALTGVRDGFRTFLDTYQAYARAVVSERASAVIDADGVAQRVRRELANKRRAAKAAQDEVKRLGIEAGTVEEQLQERRGAEQELLRSDGVRSASELAELRDQVSQLTDQAANLAASAEAARAEATDEQSDADTLHEKGRLEGEAADEVASVMTRLAATTGLIHHKNVLEQVRASDEPENTAKTMRDTVASRRADIARQRDLRAAAERAGHEAAIRDEAALRGERRVQDHEDKLVLAEEKLAAQRDALVAAAQTWLEGLEVLVLSEEQTDGLLDAANRAGDSVVNLRTALREAVEAYEAAWVRTELWLQAEKERLATEREPLETERAELHSMRTPEPERAYTRQAERGGRPGAPLWRLIDFRAEVTEQDRAGLEAALESSGLLDAWVLPDAGLLDVSNDVAVAVAEPAAGRRLSELLVPDSDAVPAEVIQGIVGAIGLGDTASPSSGVRVDVDGSFHAGPAAGRYEKQCAQFIGAAARDRNRARRLAEVMELLDRLAEHETEIDCNLEALNTNRAGLQGELANLPSEDGAHSAFEAVTDLQHLLSRLRSDAKDAREESDKVQMTAANARQAAVDHARLQRLPVPGERPSLEGLESDLAEYSSRIGDLVLHAGSVRRYHAQSSAAEVRAARANDRATELERQHQQCETRLQQRRGALQLLEQTQGDDAENALARLERVQSDIRTLDSRAKDAATSKETAVAEHARLDQAIAGDESTVRDRETDVERKLVLFRALDDADFLRLAVDDEAPTATELPCWQAAQVAEFFRVSVEPVRPADRVENLTNLVESGYQRLVSELDGSVGVQPFRQRQEGLDVVAATRGGREVPVRVLMGALEEEITAQERNLTEQDQKTFERFLFNGIAQELRNRIKAAQELVADTNDAIARCQTSSGMSIELSWEPIVDEDPLMRRALQLLRSAPEALSSSERDQLIRFFRDRVEAARLAQDEGTATEHLLDALDYRQWHRFRVLQNKDGIKIPLTKKQHQVGSGGEKAAALHLPLFAAAAAQMRSAAPHAPRLVMLDEAFAGIDNNMRPQLLGLMETFDLDFMLTSHELWCCERELEHLSIYQVHREEGVPGVATVHFLWDGAAGALTEVEETAAAA
jgi:uncharacterized protein (TIGR02680 family)